MLAAEDASEVALLPMLRLLRIEAAREVMGLLERVAARTRRESIWRRRSEKRMRIMEKKLFGGFVFFFFCSKQHLPPSKLVRSFPILLCYNLYFFFFFSFFQQVHRGSKASVEWKEVEEEKEKGRERKTC